MRLAAIIIFCLAVPAIGLSATLYVPSVYPTIQDAINAAANGDTVLVAPGTYVENIDFIGKAITVTSEQGPEVTVIDGGSPVDPDFRSPVAFHNGEGLDSVIEGFTLTKGTGTFYAPWGGHPGGGVFSGPDEYPTIRNNIICGNTPPGTGGGVCTWGAKITGNIIYNNTCDHAGGGISSGETDKFLEITNNKVFNNMTAQWCGGGIIVELVTQGIVSNNEIYDNYAYRGGGGLSFGNCTLLVENNLICDNVAGAKVANYGGGGICCLGNASVTFKNNFIVNNTSQAEGGGGIYCRKCSPTLLNNFIGGNSANRGGGLDCYEYCNPVIGNCTFWGNSANAGGAIACRKSSTMEIIDSIFWYNEPATGKEIYIGAPSFPSTLTISYSDLKGGQASVGINGGTLNWGPGMIDLDPLYTAGPSGFHYLGQTAAGQPANSPCVDTGSDLASNLGMDVYWTRTDEVIDSGTVDMGYHYGDLVFPWLQADTFAIPESAGGEANFLLLAGAENANRTYILLGGISGTDPGTPLPGGEVTLPLNWDFFTNVILQYVNSPMFHDFMGTLDIKGSGTAQLNIGPVPGGAQIIMHFAYALNGPWNFVSNPVAVEIVP